jgi:hypothetical protein
MVVNAQSKLEIPAPAEAVWSTVRDFSGICKILPMFESLGCNGNMPGSIRKLKSGDGILVERLESLDDTRRVLRYSILEPTTPMNGYVGTIEVRETGAGRCEVIWSSAFEAAGSSEDEVKTLVEGIYTTGLANLARLHR